MGKFEEIKLKAIRSAVRRTANIVYHPAAKQVMQNRAAELLKRIGDTSLSSGSYEWQSAVAELKILSLVLEAYNEVDLAE